MPRKLTVGSCFSGIGGLELGLEWTGGFETKWQIEIDPYATKVLEKHWPNVKRYADITKVKGSELEPVDLICGGFPCQDVSFAGKRSGLKGKRTNLWSELFRLVCEVKPRWFLGENVPGLFSSDDGQFFGNILRDLASAGYDAEWGVLSAAGVGAPHLRARIFIMAFNTNGNDVNQIGVRKELKPTPATSRISNGEGASQMVADTKSIYAQRLNDGSREGESGRGGWWSVEPDVGRVAHGVPSRVDRLRCLGNAVVPQVAEKIGGMILDKEFKGK